MREKSEDLPTTANLDVLDAFAWFAIPLLILGVPVVGAVSGDAIAHSVAFDAGLWKLNPNHLLFEPLGAWWSGWAATALEWIGVKRGGPDRLVLLSLTSGAASAGIFRLYAARALSLGRARANAATGTLVFCSAYSRMLVNGEHFMVEMPFLIASALATLLFVTSGRTAHAVGSGIGMGLASLVMISHTLLAAATGLATAVWLLASGRRRLALTYLLSFGGASLIVLVSGLAAGWSLVPDRPPVLQWLTSYGGGDDTRAALAYGVRWSPRGLAGAAARAVYGSVCSLVDVQPVVRTLRDGLGTDADDAVRVMLAGVWMMLVGVLTLGVYRARSKATHAGVFVLSGSWLLATLAFGWLWDNSDDQFYFHLAVLPALLVSAARLPASRPALSRAVWVLLSIALTFNLLDLFRRYVLFPRERHVAALREAVGAAQLIVTPGMTMADNLLWCAGERYRARVVTVTGLAERFRSDEGLERLDSIVDRVRRDGGKVVYLEIFDTPRLALPWKHLDRMGYRKEDVLRVLGAHAPPGPSRHVEGYTVR